MPTERSDKERRKSKDVAQSKSTPKSSKSRDAERSKSTSKTKESSKLKEKLGSKDASISKDVSKSKEVPNSSDAAKKRRTSGKDDDTNTIRSPKKRRVENPLEGSSSSKPVGPKASSQNRAGKSIEAAASLNAANANLSNSESEIDTGLTVPENTTETGLHMITARLYLPLLPISQASPLATTVADALSPMLLTYHPPFKGFVLAHKNARCGGPPSDNAGEMGRVTDEYATAFVWITVDTLVFRPNKGAWLTGVVNIQNESHIGLMVWNLFNATVEKKRLPRGWTWRPDTGDEFTQPLNTAGKNPAKRVYKKGDLGAWHDAHGNKVSGELVFRAIDFDIPTEKERDRGLLSIEGSLVSKERDAEIYALENEEEKERQAARTAKRGLF